jgi:hypothetical protein
MSLFFPFHARRSSHVCTQKNSPSNPKILSLEKARVSNNEALSCAIY